MQPDLLPETEADALTVHHHHNYGFLGGALRALPAALIIPALYAGTGALCHVWHAGIEFQRDSLWSWGWLLAWPVGLLVIAAKWIVIALGVILGLCVIAWMAYVAYRAISTHLMMRDFRKGQEKIRAGRTDLE